MFRELEFEFVMANWGRSISDDNWEVVDAAHIDTWRSACSRLSERRVSHGCVSYDVGFDWSPSLRKYQKGFAALKKHNTIAKREPRDSKWEAAMLSVKWPARRTKNRIIVKTDDDKDHVPQLIVESILADIFLMMNLAAPGCCDFQGARLGKSRRYPDVAFSSFHFEISQIRGSDGKWPGTKIIDLEKVVSWFDSVRTPLSQLPRNPMERALFSLFHISKMEMAPPTIIWLFYGLESLLQTQPGENLSTLVKRVNGILEPSERQQKLLKKKMRSLYNYRSAIVHGGLETLHPLFSEALEPEVEKKYQELDDAAGFGFSILLACIQKCIEVDWKYPTFTEAMEGLPLDIT